MTKKCSHCNTDKPFSDFNKHPTGSLGLQAWCKQCYRDAVNLRYKTDKPWAALRNKRKYSRRKLHPDYRNKQIILRKKRRLKAKQLRSDYIKTNGPCVSCGSWLELQFDHIKRHGLGGKVNKTPSQAMWLWGEQRRLDELSKCQILCKLCHRKKSGLEQRKYDHGLNLYERHGCRCEICRAASAAKKRLQRQKSFKNQVALKRGITLHGTPVKEGV